MKTKLFLLAVMMMVVSVAHANGHHCDESHVRHPIVYPEPRGLR